LRHRRCCETLQKSIGFPAENSPLAKMPPTITVSPVNHGEHADPFGTPPNGDRHRRAADFAAITSVVIRAEQRILFALDALAAIRLQF